MKALHWPLVSFPSRPTSSTIAVGCSNESEEAAEAGRTSRTSRRRTSGYAGVDIPDIAALDWGPTDGGDAGRSRRRPRATQGVGAARLDASALRTGTSRTIPSTSSKPRQDRRPLRQAVLHGALWSEQADDGPGHYSPGDRFVTFRVKGVTCGVLICYDYRFPELYRHYRKLGVHILLQSFHNARTSASSPTRSTTSGGRSAPATMSCRAAENHFWVSANNSTTRPSRWPSFTVRPDGQIVGRLKLHTPGVLMTRMVLDPSFFDAPGPWRGGDERPAPQRRGSCMIRFGGCDVFGRRRQEEAS